MKKKNIIISSIVAWLIVIWTWAYFTLANDDYFCYNYTSSSSCSIDKNNCTDWIDWKRTCSWVKTTRYVRWNYYFCWTSWSESRSTYSVNSTCSEEFTDVTVPAVSGWGFE